VQRPSGWAEYVLCLFRKYREKMDPIHCNAALVGLKYIFMMIVQAEVLLVGTEEKVF
jgi:hypothetical protein